MKLHGGKIWVSWSEVGKGTAFRVWVPYGKGHLDATKVAEDVGDAAGVGMDGKGVSEQFVQEAMSWIGSGSGSESGEDEAKGRTDHVVNQAGGRDGEKESQMPLPVTWSATGASVDKELVKPYIL